MKPFAITANWANTHTAPTWPLLFRDSDFLHFNTHTCNRRNWLDGIHILAKWNKKTKIKTLPLMLCHYKGWTVCSVQYSSCPLGSAQLPDCSFCELVHQRQKARARAQTGAARGCHPQSTLPATEDVIPRLYVYSCRLCTLFNSWSVLVFIPTLASRFSELPLLCCSFLFHLL